jgi:hypothetical protein
MPCLICNDLTRVLSSAEVDYHSALLAPFYLVSTEVAAKMRVDMERAKIALAEHQESCDPIAVTIPYPSCLELEQMFVATGKKDQ